MRARVAGVLLKRSVQGRHGGQAGQPLFQIDPAPLRAALDAALASLAQAQATATNSHVAAQQRRASWRPSGLVSRSDLDNARGDRALHCGGGTAGEGECGDRPHQSGLRAGHRADLRPRRATGSDRRARWSDRARRRCSRPWSSSIRSTPISISRPCEVERLRRAQSSGASSLVEPNKALVQLTLPDGSRYGRRELWTFSDVAVEPTTGAVALRGLIPNPEGQLLPGMYVNVRLTIGTLNHAFLCLRRPCSGTHEAPTCSRWEPTARCCRREFPPMPRDGQDWIVTSGLGERRPGDRLRHAERPAGRSGAIAVPYDSRSRYRARRRPR